ncbi:hypothetical protein V6N12_034205 [Hibiscus sabdariffa]|uniref:Uncharacterized protein n=1 Tax=Hibiscus sabdariffa TaxID=183260 RepID=A0ABR2BH26_9ROSI
MMKGKVGVVMDVGFGNEIVKDEQSSGSMEVGGELDEDDEGPSIHAHTRTVCPITYADKERLHVETKGQTGRYCILPYSRDHFSHGTHAQS